MHDADSFLDLKPFAPYSPTGLTSFFILSAGMIIPPNQFGNYVAWAQWVNYMKYSFQALVTNQFSEAAEASYLLPMLGLDTPSTIWGNVIILLGWYSGILLIIYICLCYFNKERR